MGFTKVVRTPQLDISGLRKTVTKRRCTGYEKYGNQLNKAIEAYNQSKITKDFLIQYYVQLRGAVEK